MSSKYRPPSLASPLYPGRFGEPDRLYSLLPADLRRRDALEGKVLQALLRVLGSQYDLLEGDILRLYDDLSVETCRVDLLPYLGDLLGFQLPRTATSVEVGGSADAARAARQSSLVRRLIGGLIASRRRKGSIAEARRLVREFGQASSRVVETIQRIDRTPAVRRPAGQAFAAHDFGPSVRGWPGPSGAGSPYSRVPLTAEVRRVQSQPDATPGRAHPDGLEVYLGRLNSYEITKAKAHHLVDRVGYLYRGTFDPAGMSIPLLTRALAVPGPGEAVGEDHFVAPIRRGAMTARLLDYYGAGKAVQVWVNGKAVEARDVIVADLPDAPGSETAQWVVSRHGLATGRLLIDPERGRFAHRLVEPDPKARQDDFLEGKDIEVRVTYQTGLIAKLGGGGYARQMRPVDNDEALLVVKEKAKASSHAGEKIEPGKHYRCRSLKEALDLFTRQDSPPSCKRVVIELADNSTFLWTPTEVLIPPGSRLTIRSRSTHWPLIVPDRGNQMKLIGQTDNQLSARLVLEGLRISGGLYLEGNLRAVIRDTTLLPNTLRHCESANDQPWLDSLCLHGVGPGVVLERSILGQIQVFPMKLEDPTPLVVRDSIVNVGTTRDYALRGVERFAPGERGKAGCEPPPAYAALVLRRSTVFGPSRVHQVVLASDSILTDRCDVARRQTGCLRFCYLPFESSTPPRYRCQPDLARANLRRQLQTQSPPTDPNSPAAAAKLAAESQRLVPPFASRHYGSPYYGALHSGVAAEIRTGAEDGGELGAFHDLDLPARDLELLAQLSEAVPASIDVRLIIHPESLS